MITLDTFKQDRFRGEFPKLPICLLLAGTHLFVKEDSLKLCGWVDKTVFDKIEEVKIERIKAKGKKPPSIEPSPATINGVPFVHVFNDKNEEGGLSFPNPRMHILASSPRLVEVTENGAKAGLGRKGAIIGNFEFDEGYKLHYQGEREQNLTTLRTLHMIMLVDANNEPLHKVPLVLSVHGGAATIFGNQVEMYFRLLEIAMTEHFNDNYYSLNDEARASAVFQPTFGIEAVGSTLTSDVCAVVDFVEPKPDTLEQHLNLAHAETLWNTRKSLGKFAARYMQQFEKFHAIAPGVELDEFPEERFGHTMPKNDHVAELYQGIQDERLKSLENNESIPHLYKETKGKNLANLDKDIDF